MTDWHDDRDVPAAKPGLPVYQAKKSKDFPGFIVVMCPREDCVGTKADRPFIVHAQSWLRPNRILNKRTGVAVLIVGRSCPYCFRVGRLPNRSQIR